jgi:uncharacterized membrane protein HdeD (DUF308 family)
MISTARSFIWFALIFQGGYRKLIGDGYSIPHMQPAQISSYVRWLLALGIIALVDGMLVLANTYGLQSLALTAVLGGILLAGVYVWQGQKKQRRHRRWFEEG